MCISGVRWQGGKGVWVERGGKVGKLTEQWAGTFGEVGT